MSLDQKIAELDDFINKFLKEHFPEASIEEIKPHLINYIKKDKNVIAFSRNTSEETEFTIEWFIKKACDKYYKQVMAYKEVYFNEQDDNLSSNKLIDSVLDRFYGCMESHIDKFLAETYPKQDFSFLSSKLNNILTNREDLRLAFRNDEEIQKHAKFLSSYSPYDLEGLLFLEDIIEELAASEFSKILKKELNALQIKKGFNITRTELLELSERAEQLSANVINTNWKQKLKEEKEPVSLFSFLHVFWKKLKNLFNKQGSSRQLYSTTTPSTSSFFRPTHLAANKAVVLNDNLDSLDRSSYGP